MKPHARHVVEHIYGYANYAIHLSYLPSVTCGTTSRAEKNILLWASLFLNFWVRLYGKVVLMIMIFALISLYTYIQVESRIIKKALQLLTCLLALTSP